MSKKLIIVWLVAIVLFLGLGLFGFLNQNLLLNGDNNSAPVKEKDTTKTCSIALNNSNLVYQFKLDGELIKKLTITFYDNSGDLNLYTAASKISNHVKEGLTSSISGESNEYKLITLIDYTNYNETKIEEIKTELTTLGININDSTDYATYSNYLKTVNVNNSITCD